MQVYRLADARYPDLSGRGGLHGAGRWHSAGQPVVYTAGSRALAALERFVHESAADMPKLQMISLWMPDDLPIRRVTAGELPAGWDDIPDTEASRAVGDDWLARGLVPLLQVPSALIEAEYNLLINPSHPAARRVRIVDRRNFYYDARLRRMVR